MGALKESLKRDGNEWVRTNVYAMPDHNLVTVDQRVQSNGVWKPRRAKTAPSMFLSVTAALIVWVVSARWAVITHKRSAYQEEVNQRLLDVTKMCAPHLKPASRKAKLIRMARCRRVNSRPRKVRRTNGR